MAVIRSRIRIRSTTEVRAAKLVACFELEEVFESAGVGVLRRSTGDEGGPDEAAALVGEPSAAQTSSTGFFLPTEM
jgi:hypothetical protein